MSGDPVMPTTVTRPATERDAEDVHGLTREVWAAYAGMEPPSSALRETVEDVVQELRTSGGLVVRARADGRLLAAVRFAEHDGGFWLRRLAVHPDVRRRGLAGSLVAAGEESAHDRGYDELRVGVRSALGEIAGFWRRRGFCERAAHGHWVEFARPLPVGLEVPTADDMHALGRRLAALLRAGDLVVLSGDLGAGKTTLTQGLGAGLDVRGAVTSPTFVIARVHPSTSAGPPLVHVDAYRLGGFAEVDDLDLDASAEESVTVVEWGEGKVEELAESRLEVQIRRSADEADERRWVMLRARGCRWSAAELRPLRALERACRPAAARLGRWPRDSP